MITTNEMKDILVAKFKDENCSFKKSDINIKKVNNCYDIIIKDYEHISFKMLFDKDNYFGYCVFINENCMGDIDNIIFVDNKSNYDIESALIYLGYHIANTF